jgi:hypothetical protein
MSWKNLPSPMLAALELQLGTVGGQVNGDAIVPSYGASSTPVHAPARARVQESKIDDV